MSLIEDGVWKAQSLSFPTEYDYMIFDTRRSRVITYVTVSIEPVKRTTIRCWYLQTMPGLLKARLQPNGKWRDLSYKDSDSTLYWDQPEGCQPWFQISEDAVPDWLRIASKKANLKMDGAENTAEQGAAANP